MEESGTYRCTIYYDKRWETELLIQVLSFGPVVKVLGPESFLSHIHPLTACFAVCHGIKTEFSVPLSVLQAAGKEGPGQDAVFAG